MGLGQSQGTSEEASFPLKDSIPAGSWHVIMDATIITACNITFELIWRRTGAADMDIAMWQKSFAPIAGDFDAQAYELDQPATAIDFLPGDLLVFRYSSDANTTSAEAFIPNGDGARSNGRIPNFTLPQ